MAQYGFHAKDIETATVSNNNKFDNIYAQIVENKDNNSLSIIMDNFTTIEKLDLFDSLIDNGFVAKAISKHECKERDTKLVISW